ncbi:MAG: hypothetical protein K0U36_06835 [Alphaproteobacteria bacterium]|nr:hypothetical protein [Alphaproteobacteria bacterium]
MEAFLDWSRYVYYAVTIGLGGLIYWVKWSIKQSTVSQRDFDEHLRTNERDFAALEASIGGLATKDDLTEIRLQLTTIMANQNQHAKQTEALIKALEGLPTK